MAKMQSIEKYQSLYAGNGHVLKIIELCHADFEGKKQGEAFNFMLSQLASLSKPTEGGDYEKMKNELLQFVEKQSFAVESHKKAIVYIVENLFVSMCEMKAKGKFIWQNTLLMLGHVYRQDTQITVNIINFKPAAKANEQRYKALTQTVESEEVEQSQPILLDEPECDTCGKTIRQDELPIARMPKRRKK